MSKEEQVFHIEKMRVNKAIGGAGAKSVRCEVNPKHYMAKYNVSYTDGDIELDIPVCEKCYNAFVDKAPRADTHDIRPTEDTVLSDFVSHIFRRVIEEEAKVA